MEGKKYVWIFQRQSQPYLLMALNMRGRKKTKSVAFTTRKVGFLRGTTIKIQIQLCVMEGENQESDFGYV